MRYSNTQILGVIETNRIVTKDIGWIFREQPICDVGIDAIIEQVDLNNPMGKFIALQIKTGESSFKISKDKLTYYASNIHCDYWLNLNIPVLLIAHLPIKEETYWAVIKKSTVQKTKKNWKIDIPIKNKFNKESKNQLVQILSHQKKKTYTRYKRIFDKKTSQYNFLDKNIGDFYEENKSGEFPFLKILNVEKLKKEILRVIKKVKGDQHQLFIIWDFYLNDAIGSVVEQNDRTLIVINTTHDSFWGNFALIHSLMEIYFNLGEAPLSKPRALIEKLKKTYETKNEINERLAKTISIIVSPKDRKLVYEIGRALIEDSSRPYTNKNLAEFYKMPEEIIKLYREKIETEFFKE